MAGVSGGSDDGGSKIIQAFQRSPFSAMTFIGGIIAATTLWLNQTAGIEKANDRMTLIERRMDQTDKDNREDKREASQKYDRMQNDIGDIKASVRGMSVGIDGLNRNFETFIRQNSQTTPPR